MERIKDFFENLKKPQKEEIIKKPKSKFPSQSKIMVYGNAPKPPNVFMRTLGKIVDL